MRSEGRVGLPVRTTISKNEGQIKVARTSLNGRSCNGLPLRKENGV